MAWEGETVYIAKAEVTANENCSLFLYSSLAPVGKYHCHVCNHRIDFMLLKQPGHKQKGQKGDNSV